MRTFAIATLLISACGVRQLDPMPAPPRTMPQLPEDIPPPQPGTTPVAIDADVPSKVYDELGRDICLTPCVVNLEPGVRDLDFHPIDHFSERLGHPSISVGSRPLVMNYALGRHEQNSGLWIGGTSLLIGGSVVAFSAIPLAIIPNTRDIGVDLELAASAAVVSGIILMIAGRDTVQMGASTVWSPMSPMAVSATR